jgi:hypothetical protein
MYFKIAFGIKNNRNRQLFKRMATGKQIRNMNPPEANYLLFLEA